MQKINRAIVVICALIMFLILIAMNAYAYSSKKEISIGVLSDTHLMQEKSSQDDKFETALEILNKKAGGRVDALVVAGDLTDDGASKSYDRFNKIYSSIMGDTVQKLFVMGNHEYYNGLNPKESQKRFCMKTGMNLNERKVINGYSFILVNTQDAAIEGTFDSSTLDYLKRELDKATCEDEKKPIFVIVHQPIKGTVFGSDRDCDEKLDSILKNYSNVICLSGHSHYPINDERSINQKDYTCINIGGLRKLDIDTDAVNYKDITNTEIAMGLYIEGKGSKITITRIDFMNNKQIKDKWVIDTSIGKEGYKYTDARKLERKCPHFNNKAKVSVLSCKGDNAKIKFSKADHEDFVYCYLITVNNKDTMLKEGEFKIISDFYNDISCDSFIIDLNNLSKGTTYNITIKATESFGNCSDNNLSCDFTT